MITPPFQLSKVRWDVDAVDGLLDDILRSTEQVNHLIIFTAEDAEIAAQVGCTFLGRKHLLFSSLANISQHQTIDQILWPPRELESSRFRIQKFSAYCLVLTERGLNSSTSSSLEHQ
jgi:hypothetical protein